MPENLGNQEISNNYPATRGAVEYRISELVLDSLVGIQLTKLYSFTSAAAATTSAVPRACPSYENP